MRIWSMTAAALLLASCGAQDASSAEQSVGPFSDFEDEVRSDHPPELVEIVEANVSAFLPDDGTDAAAAMSCDEFTYRRHRERDDAFLVACPSGLILMIEDGVAVSFGFIAVQEGASQ